jgi:hypothetical protein
VGIEGIISQKFCWCFWASQTPYNGRTLESELQNQLEHFWLALKTEDMTDLPQYHLSNDAPIDNIIVTIYVNLGWYYYW